MVEAGTHQAVDSPQVVGAGYHIFAAVVGAGRNHAVLVVVEPEDQEVEDTWEFEVEPCTDPVADDLLEIAQKELGAAEHRMVAVVDFYHHPLGRVEAVEDGRELNVNGAHQPGKNN